MKIKIADDLFDIASRLKEINPEYEVFFDTDLQKFVVYSRGKAEVTLPYENLDERALIRVYETRVENADALIEEIERQNRAVERGAVKNARDAFENELSHTLRVQGI